MPETVVQPVGRFPLHCNRFRLCKSRDHRQKLILTDAWFFYKLVISIQAKLNLFCITLCTSSYNDECFLANSKTMPLSLLIPQLDAQSFIEGTAFVSLMILGLNLMEKLFAFLLKWIHIHHKTF